MLRREKRLTNLSLNVVDLFCGAGGLSLGFQKAGFDLLLAADNDAKAIQTYRKNIGNHAYVEDSLKA
jgi:DNA (cytosine-5)-methyltransferase 1